LNYIKSQELKHAFESLVGSSGYETKYSTIRNNFSASLLTTGQANVDKYTNKYIVGASLIASEAETYLRGYYSPVYPHSCPLAINILSNTMLRQMETENIFGYSIEVTNHPLSTTSDYSAAISSFDVVSLTAPYIVGVFLSIGLILTSASLIVMPVEEKLTHCKQLQLMTGVNPFVYWGATFVCDYLILLLEFCLILICLAVLDVHTFFTNNNGTGSRDQISFKIEKSTYVVSVFIL